MPQLIFLHSNFTLYKCTIFIIVAVFESKFTQFYFGKLDLLSNFIFQGVGSGNNNLVHRERQKIISLVGNKSEFFQHSHHIFTFRMHDSVNKNILVEFYTCIFEVVEVHK